MDCKSLMIGDWVTISNCDGSWKKQVVGVSCHIYEGTFCNAPRIDFGSFVKEEIDCAPIPLTEEILKANGFYKGSYVGGYLHRDFMFRVYPVDSTFPATSFVYEESPINETIFYCHYVHELQHALRLCGLNELADNIKVE